MALEVNASRMLAPYFGTSLFVWSSIIGIVLLSLSLGYYYGGKLADKYPKASVLYALLLGVSIWMTALPWLSTALLSYTSMYGISYSLVVAAVLVSILLFLPPSTVMGMVSPYVLKLYADQLKDLGSEAGKLYAISTLGSLIGTFLPAVATIPLLGSLKTTLLFAFLLSVTAVIGLGKKWLIIFPLITALLFVFAHPTFSQANSIFQTESSYGFINIYEKNNIRYLQLDAPFGVHSLKNPDTLLTYNYWDYFLGIAFTRPTKQTLVLGLAGGNITSLFSYYFPSMEMDGVEIDTKIVDAANKYFDLAKPNLTAHIDDARSFLNQTTEKYDLIVLDAYHNLNIPVHVSTQEFFQLAKKNLTPNGVFAMNIAHSVKNSSLDGYLAPTLHTAFPYVYSIDTNQGYNTILIGTDTPWTNDASFVDKKLAHPELGHIWAKYPPLPVTDFDNNKIQTDDNNILELIASQEVFQNVK